MRLRVIALPLLAVVAVPALPAASARDAGVGSPNVSHVKNIKYQNRYGQTTPYGTDLEFVNIDVTGLAGAPTGVSGVREFALAGTERNGLQIIDITDPANAEIAAVYDCAIAQGDVQVFNRDGRTLVTYTADDISGQTDLRSTCHRDANLSTTDKVPSYGTYIADISNPYKPVSVSFIPVPQGSHNQTVHPSGKWLYNSNSEGNRPDGRIEVIDISDPAKPKLTKTLLLQTGSDSHDVTFSADGKRAYTAALSHTLVLNTEDPGNPTVISRIVDPSITLAHQSEPVTLTDPVYGTKTFLVVTDELQGGGTDYHCPGGGLHIFDITGPLEQAPVKVGFWNMPNTFVNQTINCTSHVLRFYPEHKLMTIAWYSAGVRVVDVSALVGVSVGADPTTGNVGRGMKEVGYFVPDNADTWSAKTNKIAADGSFYLFGNDIKRGFDVYRFQRPQAATSDGGTWLSPSEALQAAQLRRATSGPVATAPRCNLAV